MCRYIRHGYITNKKDADALQQFFSPSRVSGGLERDEIRLCITLFPIRAQQKELHEELHSVWISQADLRRNILLVQLMLSSSTQDEPLPHEKLVALMEKIDAQMPPEPDVMTRFPTFSPPMLPDELRGEEPMTRERFRRGIRIFLETALKAPPKEL
ncbi:MAG: hypothetical protein AAB381_02095 [Patescibacteria group bacterium]